MLGEETRGLVGSVNEDGGDERVGGVSDGEEGVRDREGRDLRGEQRLTQRGLAGAGAGPEVTVGGVLAGLGLGVYRVVAEQGPVAQVEEVGENGQEEDEDGARPKEVRSAKSSNHYAAHYISRTVLRRGASRVDGEGAPAGLAGGLLDADGEEGDVGGAAGAELLGEAGGEPLGQALGGGVIDGEGDGVRFRDDITSVSEADFVLIIALGQREVGVVEGEEEAVVELLAEGGGDALELDEVDDPAVGGEVAVDLDEEGVVVAVEGLALVGEGGEVSGGKAKGVSLDGGAVLHGGLR